MEIKKIKKLLKDVEEKRISSKAAFYKLKALPYEDMGFAKIDNHRNMRTGFPEIIFCQGKSTKQIAEIFLNISKHSDSILATKASMDAYLSVSKLVPLACYHETAKIISFKKNKKHALGKRFISIFTAGTSDIPIAEEAVVTAEFLGVRVKKIYDVGVAGIHRLFDNIDNLFDASVNIVVAGMDGALPSVIGGLSRAPVIAVPTSIGYGASFEGLAALLTMLNSCAPGIATVNIDNGFGAACIAVSIINTK